MGSHMYLQRETSHGVRTNEQYTRRVTWSFIYFRSILCEKKHNLFVKLGIHAY